MANWFSVAKINVIRSNTINLNDVINHNNNNAHRTPHQNPLKCLNSFRLWVTTSFVARWNIIASHSYTFYSDSYPQSTHMRSYLTILMILLLLYISLSSIVVVGCRWWLLIIIMAWFRFPNWKLISSFSYVIFLRMYFIRNNCQISEFAWIWLQWHPFGIDCMAFLSRIFVSFIFSLSCSTSFTSFKPQSVCFFFSTICTATQYTWYDGGRECDTSASRNSGVKFRRKEILTGCGTRRCSWHDEVILYIHIFRIIFAFCTQTTYVPPLSLRTQFKSKQCIANAWGSIHNNSFRFRYLFLKFFYFHFYFVPFSQDFV